MLNVKKEILYVGRGWRAAGERERGRGVQGEAEMERKPVNVSGL